MSGYVPGNTLAFGVSQTPQGLCQRARYAGWSRNLSNAQWSNTCGYSRPT